MQQQNNENTQKSPMVRITGFTGIKSSGGFEEAPIPSWVGILVLTAAAVLSWVYPSASFATEDDNDVPQSSSGSGEYEVQEVQLMFLFVVVALFGGPIYYYLSQSSGSASTEEAPAKKLEEELHCAKEQAKRLPEPESPGFISSSSGSLSPSSRRSWSASRFRAAKSPQELAKGKIRSCLNKLTEERFDSLFEQLVQACLVLKKNEDAEEQQGLLNQDQLLECLVKEVFEKATQQHTHRDDHFITLYTKLCSRMHERLGGKGTGRKVGLGFRKLLREQCQVTFEQYREAPIFPEDIEEEELLEEKLKHKTRRLGNMKFAGYLLSQELLSAELPLSWADLLLREDEDSDAEDDLEAMCALLTVAGPFFDREMEAQSMEFESLMNKLSTRLMLAEKQNLPKRVSFLIRDLLDLRCRSWGARKKPEQKAPEKQLNLALKEEKKSQKPKDSNRMWSDIRKTTELTGSAPKKIVVAAAGGEDKAHTPQQLAALWFGENYTKPTATTSFPPLPAKTGGRKLVLG